MINRIISLAVLQINVVPGQKRAHLNACWKKKQQKIIYIQSRRLLALAVLWLVMGFALLLNVWGIHFILHFKEIMDISILLVFKACH